MTIRCISIDDESLARKGLALQLNRYSDFELVGQFSDPQELLINLPVDIDLMFVDIEMPRLNGFDLLKQLPQPLPIIVFVTAYDQYAIRAFENQALDYVLKPIDQRRFEQVIKRVRDIFEQQKQVESSDKLLKTIDELQSQIAQPEPELSVKTDEGYFQIKLNELYYLEAAGDHVCLHFENKQLITRGTLKKYEVQLTEKGFCRIHKSYIVNARKVRQLTKARFGDYQLSLLNGIELRVSRNYKSVLSKFVELKS